MLTRIAIVISILILMSINAFAEDKIPREDFIKYTEGCMDAIDELNAGFTQPDCTKHEAKRLIAKYDACYYKFQRYGSFREWDKESLQFDIVEKIHNLAFELMLGIEEMKLGKDTYMHMCEEIRKASEEVGPKLVKYKGISLKTLQGK